MLNQFILADLVPKAERPRFDAAVRDLVKWRDSVLDRQDALALLIGAVLPFLPLFLTVFPLEELAQRALRVMF